MDKRHRGGVRRGKDRGCTPLKERDLVPCIISEDERRGRVRVLDQKKILFYSEFLHPGVIRTSFKITTDSADKPYPFPEGCNTGGNICGTSPEKNRPSGNQGGLVFVRQAGDSADMVRRRMTDDLNQRTSTSVILSGTSRSAFPITDLAILVACS